MKKSASLFKQKKEHAGIE